MIEAVEIICSLINIRADLVRSELPVSLFDRGAETGKIKRSGAILDTAWLDSFGLSVDEHTASTQIDLMDGFVSSDITEPGKNDGPDLIDMVEV